VFETEKRSDEASLRFSISLAVYGEAQSKTKSPKESTGAGKLTVRNRKRSNEALKLLFHFFSSLW